MNKQKEKGLSAWQLTMMALGTVIGGSFFLGSSVAINAAGPSIVLAYILGGIMVYFILFALSEMTVANPDKGSFRTFAAQAFGKGTGFVVGWVYWTGMILAMSSEATAISILLREWFPALSLPIVGGIIIIGVTLVNLLGAQRLSKLESGLAAVKIFAIASFILLAVLLIFGLVAGNGAAGAGAMATESFMPGGFGGFAGSMLIVMFAYAGFEIIGLAASEAREPKVTIPKAIRNTVFLLIGLYITSVTVLLPLISTADVNPSTSPFVSALGRQGIGWAGGAINIVLITAILSTMLAAMFGLGRMMRSLVDEGMAPSWLKDHRDVPYRGIIASGVAMLIALAFGLLFPSAYLFLISSGGFSLLFTYAVIMATQLRLRKRNGCPPTGCQLWGYPYTSIIVLIFLIATMASMPFVVGQASGLIAGGILVGFFMFCYMVMRVLRKDRSFLISPEAKDVRAKFITEVSAELGSKEKSKVEDENGAEEQNDDKQ